MGLMCPGRKLPKVWGQPFVLWCLGLRKDRGVVGRREEGSGSHGRVTRLGFGKAMGCG